MHLEPLGQDLWSYRFPLRFAGLPLGGRTTIARLGDGSLWVHSPGPLDDEGAAQVAALGTVSALIAPCNTHHLHLARWAERFPAARRFGTAGLAKKGVGVDAQLTRSAPSEWTSALGQIALGGIPFTDEVVFFHHPSKTLLLADLCFNLRGVDGWLSRLGLRLNGALDRFGPSRLTKAAIQDRAAVATAVERMLEWPFDQISVCHGELQREGAREALREAFAWL